MTQSTRTWMESQSPQFAEHMASEVLSMLDEILRDAAHIPDKLPIIEQWATDIMVDVHEVQWLDQQSGFDVRMADGSEVHVQLNWAGEDPPKISISTQLNSMLMVLLVDGQEATAGDLKLIFQTMNAHFPAVERT